MNNRASGPTKVLFLAWGYSIHAYRRIKIFADDSRFIVELVSNHRYAIPGVVCHPLFRSKSVPEKVAAGSAAGTSPSLCKRVTGFLSRVLIIRLGYDLLAGVIDLWRLFRVYRQYRPDVVFLQTLLYPCYLAYALPRRVPLVVTFWNGDVLWWAKWNGIERLAKKWLVSHGARRADAVTVNSAAARDACLRYGVESRRIHLLRYPGVDLERFSPGSRDSARQKLGIVASHVILCPRGFADYVNSDVILAAARIVSREFPEVLFLFTSSDGQEAYLRYLELAGQLGVLERMRWDGAVPWELMPDYYRAADAMVSISAKDSLPNSMLEAMGCGVPLIMGDIPEIAEWVVDGENGYVVPVRDAEVLAAHLLALLRGAEPRAAAWVEHNRRMVEEQVDSRVNCEVVKQLVANLKGAA